MKLFRTCLLLASLFPLISAQDGQAPKDELLQLPPMTCRTMAPIQFSPDRGSLARAASGPLVIVPQWDASLLASNQEGYAIGSNSNKLLLKINGVTLPVITLTTGPNRQADEIAAELNAVSAFKARADATAWGGPNGYVPPNAVNIRSKGAAFGSLEFLNTANSAHVVLGFPLGVKGPDANAARRVVFEQCFRDWEAMILDGGNILSPYTARIGYTLAVPFGSVASARPILSGSNNIIGAVADFDSAENWFEDPTPGDDSEFNSGSPPTGLDLLTIIRHEMGHALGFIGNDGLLDVQTSLTAPLSAGATTASVLNTSGFLPAGSFSVDGEVINYAAKTSTQLLGLTRMNPASHNTLTTVLCLDVYDSTRLNIAVKDGGSHTLALYHPLDIMGRPFFPGLRAPINLYPTVARISRGQGAKVPLAVLDPVGAPSPDGRAGNPWPDLTSAASFTPAGIPFLLTDGIYLEPAFPLTITGAHDFILARDALVTVP